MDFSAELKYLHKVFFYFPIAVPVPLPCDTNQFFRGINGNIIQIMQPLQNCIGPTIRIGREILCLPYAGFLISLW